ncbi:FadR family transcriptional regulator [Bacillus tianshenii]|uniref:FadR/GntR family transcriptional regulator n=1 Tax=Sutcliffiella tianshenii TaxID=1463404 RepID=UPI001CD75357|nr:FadR/GntR family transcriptional regulator [Bacillus tianshenii]MCA1318630.1 FadR family transcriptional regulator [Bacillus tianshenii]
MIYKKIKPKKIYEEVADSLLQMIKQGEFHPGDRLSSVEQLSESFQVSRSAVREALSALRAMGILDIRQGEGTFIKEFHADMLSLPVSTAVLMRKDDLAHLLEIRRILEVGAVAAAAQRRNESDLAAMKKSLQEMKDAFGNEELGEQADFAFHLAIAEASQNPLLVSLMNSVSGIMVETMRETRRLWLYGKQVTSERLYHDHEQIYEAIEQQDEVLAQKRILEHLGAVEQVLSKFIRPTE